MKKYKQLILFLTSIVSLLLFLIYRHEYNRLHYVLEVFNFFGTQPCNLTDIIESNNVINHYDWGPLPLWQEYDDFYIYSSHWYDDNKVRSLALSIESKTPKNCYLHYEDNSPVIGKLKYSRLTNVRNIAYNEKNAAINYVGYFYDCYKKDVVEKVPYGVSFTKMDSTRGRLTIVNHNKSKRKEFNTTVCLFVRDYKKDAMIEFVSYHALIGVEAFTIYSNNVPYRLRKILLNFQTRLGVKLTFVPWNYPKRNNYETNGVQMRDIDLERDVVRNDCLLRTLRQSNHVIMLETDEYLIPGYGKTINDVFNTYNTTSTFELPIEEFCVNDKVKKKNVPIALQYFSVRRDGMNVETVYNSRLAKGNVVSTSVFNKDTAKIHKYNWACPLDSKTYTDKSMMKYYTDFVRSTLVQFLIHDKI